MPEQNIEQLLQILSGIERKNTVEKIDGTTVRESGKIIEIQQNSILGQDGAIEDTTTYSLHTLDCGCIAQSRQDIGGKDWKGNIVCRRHFYRCAHCFLPLSSLTVRVINGKCYCGPCWWKKKFFPAFIK
ncbi:MAG: hypothetical protein WC614_12390 [bacterium]